MVVIARLTSYQMTKIRQNVVFLERHFSFDADKIDNYKCFITGERNPPAENERSAEWSPEIACGGEDRSSSK
jgi:hypothetical protein